MPNLYNRQPLKRSRNLAMEWRLGWPKDLWSTSPNIGELWNTRTMCWPREMSSIISNLHVRRKPSLRYSPPVKCVLWWRRQKQKVPRWLLEEKRARCTANYIISEALKEIILWENTFYILLCRPTILTGVTSDMQLCQEEIFGPVVSIQKFSEEKVSFLFYRQHLAKNILLKTQ